MTGTVLISGASIAGPVTAYWLHHHGWRVTVVERTPRPRLGLGGHAVDLFGGSVEVVERMGLLTEVEAARTRTEVLRLVRQGRPPVTVRVGDLVDGISASRHVEVMRGELAAILNGALPEVEFLYGDSIQTLDQDEAGVAVTFRHAPARRFDLVVGADGLHSGVRRLVFGPETGFTHFLGGYLAAATVPWDLPAGEMVLHRSVDRLVGMYPVWQSGQARAMFLFRGGEDLVRDHRDVAAHRDLLRNRFADLGPAGVVQAAAGAEDFYLDAVSQIRMAGWTRGRVALVGDAGYSPGPAVGGGTTLAVIGAFVLADQLVAAGGDHRAGFAGYTAAMLPLAVGSRRIGPGVLRSALPRNRLELAVSAPALSLIMRLPAGLRRRLTAGPDSPLRLLGNSRLPERSVPSPTAGGASRPSAESSPGS